MENQSIATLDLSRPGGETVNISPRLVIDASYEGDLLAAAVSFAAFSLLLALEFYILQAPDVAIAEAGIGAGLTTAIFVIAIRGTRRHEDMDE